ncbi:RIO1 family regulatory kinase/ATPase [Sedimentibacter sp.]|uniref:RIO1 family regulatory kinase/ATPase domain-containing protein n=1 Tax=Sedimentibacter sp. TaxID=1960295 RepID=UPI0028B0804A|nr:RIO1 family regulatory kinase/ATPase [Sedimentibacter sp.]
MYQKISLTSKRNKVVRTIENGNSFIYKTFYNDKDLKKELEILILLKQNGLTVPDVTDINDNSLILQDLGDNTLLDWYENEEKINSTDYDGILYELCRWLKKYYEITSAVYNHQYIIWDVNFRNFIIYKSEIYGIDFEQSRQGRIEEDAGRLAAYALTYDPQMTDWKKFFNGRFVNILANEFNVGAELILSEMEKELKSIKERRKKEAK